MWLIRLEINQFSSYFFQTNLIFFLTRQPLYRITRFQVTNLLNLGEILSKLIKKYYVTPP